MSIITFVTGWTVHDFMIHNKMCKTFVTEKIISKL